VRHRPSEAFDVGGERCIVFGVVRGVVADHVDHRGEGALRVVQVGQAVGQPGAGVQQRASGTRGHARISVGCTCDDALGQAQHAAHAWLAVQRGHEVHLRSAGIGKAMVHALREQGVAEQVGAGAGRSSRHARRVVEYGTFERPLPRGYPGQARR